MRVDGGGGLQRAASVHAGWRSIVLMLRVQLAVWQDESEGRELFHVMTIQGGSRISRAAR
jgi:hypothetical protein